MICFLKKFAFFIKSALLKYAFFIKNLINCCSLRASRMCDKSFTMHKFRNNYHFYITQIFHKISILVLFIDNYGMPLLPYVDNT